MTIRTALTLATALTVGLTLAARSQDVTGTPKEHRAAQHQENQAQRTEQGEENKAFRESLKGMTPEQREAAIVAHRTQQHSENDSFRAKQHEENMAFLK